MGERPILIVEDNPDIRDTFRMLFELEGFDVRLAGNGEEALDRLHDGGVEPCLILLDLSMPVMGGREFLDVLLSRDELRGLPIAVLSAEVDAATARELKARYGVRVLRKPASVEALLGIARTASGPTLH